MKVDDDFKCFEKHVAHSFVAQEALKFEVEEQRQQCFLFAQKWVFSKANLALSLSFVVDCQLYIRERLQLSPIF